jgi:hypothetical protein
MLKAVTKPIRTTDKMKRRLLANAVASLGFFNGLTNAGIGIVKAVDLVPVDSSRMFPVLEKKITKASSQAHNLFGQPALKYVPPFKS